MSNLYLKLLKIHSEHKPESGLPDAAKAYIAIKCFSKEIVDDQEFMIISSECRSLIELEDAADWLIKELKSIKQEANKFFRIEQK